MEHKICPDRVLGALPPNFERKLRPAQVMDAFVVHFCAGILRGAFRRFHPAVKYQVLPGECLAWAELVPGADPEAMHEKRTAGVFCDAWIGKLAHELSAMY